MGDGSSARAAADHALRSRIPGRIHRKHRGRVAAEIRDPQFVVHQVQGHARRILDHAPGSLEDSDGSDIAVRIRAVNRNAVARIVGDKQFPAIRMHRNRRRPVHQGLGALNHAQRCDVALASLR